MDCTPPMCRAPLPKYIFFDSRCSALLCAIGGGLRRCRGSAGPARLHSGIQPEPVHADNTVQTFTTQCKEEFNFLGSGRSIQIPVICMNGVLDTERRTLCASAEQACPTKDTAADVPAQPRRNDGSRGFDPHGTCHLQGGRICVCTLVRRAHLP